VEDQRRKELEKQKRNDYSDALKSEVQAREKMKQLDFMMQQQQQKEH
jgi:hypothetical protein